MVNFSKLCIKYYWRFFVYKLNTDAKGKFIHLLRYTDISIHTYKYIHLYLQLKNTLTAKIDKFQNFSSVTRSKVVKTN